MSEKNCDIKNCSNSFDQKSVSRGRLTKKKKKGEVVAWICPSCLKKLDDKIEWRE